MTEQQRRNILIETVNRFARKEWFRDAAVFDAWPTNGEPTLEIKVNYVPIFERKDIIDFAASVGLREKFTVVDRNGNPVE